MNENYSYLTSLPAYLENKAERKDSQCEKVLSFIKGGCNNLLLISEKSGITQAIVSARVNDLIEEGKCIYSGHVVYNNRLRKKIVLAVLVQKELFQ